MNYNLSIKSNTQTFFYTTIWFLLILISQGCTKVQLISEYDEQTDKSITQLHKKIEILFNNIEKNIEKPEGSYKANQDSYNQIKIDLSALRLRVNAIPKNDITQSQIGLLMENIELLEATHQEGISDIEIVKLIKDDFNTALTNILKLELAKKRGEN